MLADLKYAWRQLNKTPGFALTAVLTLALGIGANTAIYSIIHGALRLPYPNADRMVAIQNVYPQGSYYAVSYPDFLEWRDKAHSFSQFVARFLRPRDLGSVRIWEVRAGSCRHRIGQQRLFPHVRDAAYSRARLYTLRTPEGRGVGLRSCGRLLAPAAQCKSGGGGPLVRSGRKAVHHRWGCVRLQAAADSSRSDLATARAQSTLRTSMERITSSPTACFGLVPQRRRPSRS